LQFNRRLAAVTRDAALEAERRPAHVTYRVGQPFTHRLWGWRGVITGWDPTCRASEQWVSAHAWAWLGRARFIYVH
jgi:heat shock protein HspQ